MAFIKCPVCGIEISDSESVCPICGYSIIELKREKSKMHTHGKYARRRQKKNWLEHILLGVLVVIVFGTVSLVFLLPNNEGNDPNTFMTTLPTESENEEIISTSESLKPYLDELGRVLQDENVDASTEFIDGLSSVYIMGRTGTVGHGFSYDSGKDEMKIDVMEWKDNKTATETDFFAFIVRLRDYFGKEEHGNGSYETASGETYIWTDYQYSSYVGCWYDSGVINMRWNYDESLTDSAAVKKTDKQETITCNHDWRGSTEAGFIICHKCNAVLSSDDIKAKKGTNLSSVEKAKIYWALDSNLTTRKSNGAYLYSEDEAFSLVEKEYGVTREYLKNNIWNGHARDDYVKYYITAWK